MTEMILPEIVIEAQILEYLNSLPHAFFIKTDTKGTYDEELKTYRKSPSPWVIRGWPDITGIIGGVVILFEVKTQRGVVSKHQKGFMNKWRKCGGNVFVVRSVDEVRETLEELELIPKNFVTP